MNDKPSSVRHCLERAAQASTRAAVDERIASSDAIAEDERRVLQETASCHRRSALAHERSATSIMSSLSRLNQPFAVPAPQPASRFSDAAGELRGPRLAAYLATADVRTERRLPYAPVVQPAGRAGEQFRRG